MPGLGLWACLSSFVADGLYFMGVSGTLFWGPYNKDPTISGTILESPYFRKLPYRVTVGPWCFLLDAFWYTSPRAGRLPEFSNSGKFHGWPFVAVEYDLRYIRLFTVVALLWTVTVEGQYPAQSSKPLGLGYSSWGSLTR